MAKKPTPQQQPQPNAATSSSRKTPSPRAQTAPAGRASKWPSQTTADALTRRGTNMGVPTHVVLLLPPRRRARCYLEVACIFKNVKEWEPDDRLLRRIEAAALGQVLCPRVRLIR